MPEVYLEGTLKALSDESFTGNDGAEIKFSRAYIQCETDEGPKVLILNTKENLEEYVDRDSIFTLGLRADRQSSGFKITILKVAPATKVIE